MPFADPFAYNFLIAALLALLALLDFRLAPRPLRSSQMFSEFIGWVAAFFAFAAGVARDPISTLVAWAMAAAAGLVLGLDVMALVFLRVRKGSRL